MTDADDCHHWEGVRMAQLTDVHTLIMFWLASVGFFA